MVQATDETDKPQCDHPITQDLMERAKSQVADDLKRCPFCGRRPYRSSRHRSEHDAASDGGRGFVAFRFCNGGGYSAHAHMAGTGKTFEEADAAADAAWDTRETEAAATAVRDKVMEWKTIETAPKDGTEILGWRSDQGTFVFRYASMDDVVQRNQAGDPLEDYDDHEGWFHDIWGWMEGEETPSHWMPLPSPPCVPVRD